MSKVFWYLAAALAGLWLVRKAQKSYAGGFDFTGGQSADAQTLAIINSIATPDKGFMGPTTVLRPADPIKYPGWYRTDDGGWVSLDGGTYTLGASPPALGLTEAELHPLWVDLSLSEPATPEQIAAQAADPQATQIIY